MASIDEKRIEYVGNGRVSIPIRWGASADNIRYNNAVAMAVTIARTIDSANLWDGYIYFREVTGCFAINNVPLCTAQFADKLNFSAEAPLSFAFSENADPFRIEETIMFRTSDISDAMPNLPLNIYADDNVTIIIEFNNPIFSDDVSANLGAFEIITVHGGINYTLAVSAIEITDVSALRITVENMDTVSDDVSVLYRAEDGNLKDSISGGFIASFSRSFAYITTYSEGE